MTPSGSRNPRHRPAPVRRPESPSHARTRGGDGRTRPNAFPVKDLSAAELRARQLELHETCQWQRRMIRCTAAATDVVESRERVLRSSCEQHVPVWLRTGARRVA
jgi:hypothetical protein